LGPVLYKGIGVIAILGVVAIIYAGIQEPNGAALPVTGGLAVLLAVAWHAGIKKVFLGPPTLALEAAEAQKEEADAAAELVA